MAQSLGSNQLSAADLAVIVTYFLAMMGVGIWTIYTSKGSVNGFFLAGRSMTWWPVGMSMFASNIGCLNFVGICGAGAASGYAVIMFEWNAVWLLVLLGWVFLPVYIASGIYTMPEYLKWRFGGRRLQIYLSIVALLTYLFATISSELYSGYVFMNQTTGTSIYGAVGILLAISIVFTALGGLKTVILTDAVAVVIMVTGGLLLSFIGLNRVGGFTALQYKYMRAAPSSTLIAHNTSCGLPPPDALHTFRAGWTSGYPWLGTVLRTTLGSLWFWCANQVLVQRSLAAKDITHAKSGCILAGYLKLLPMFIMIFPGMISRTLYPDEVACASPSACEAACGNPSGCSNIALPKMVVQLLPQGIRGLLVAAMMAAVISTLTSVFNSATTLFTMDIWREARPQASPRELLFVGRVFVLVLMVLGIAWIPVMSGAAGGQVFTYATTIGGYLGAPTCAMFLLAMFWQRTNEPGAFWGMVVAQAWGLVRFVLDLVYPAPHCGEHDSRPTFITHFHAYFHTISQILIAFLIAIVVSLATKPIPPEKTAGLTFWTRREKPYRDRMREERQVAWDLTATHSTLHINAPGPEDETHMSVRERLVVALVGKKSPPVTASTSHPDDNDPENEEHAVRLARVKQSKRWATVVNVNAALLLAFTAFIFGFFY